MRTQIFKKLITEGVIKDGLVLDLGCGKGTDAINLSQMGFTVMAVDRNEESVEALKGKDGIIPVLSTIEEMPIVPDSYDMIVASYSLQFLSKRNAKKAIERMIAGTVQAGVIYFTLIGQRDEWANKPEFKWSFWKKGEFTEFIKEFPVKIRNQNIFEGIGDTINKGFKYWHVREYVLIKK